ncbi:MAG: hypothetical protein WCQ53_08895, partial [bacterium]
EEQASIEINKSDYPGADELEAFLRSSFVEQNNRVIKTSARNGQGIKELVDLVEEIYKKDNEKIKGKSHAILKEGLKYLLLQEISHKVDEIINHASLSLDDIASGSKSPYSEMKRLLKGGFLKW